MVKTSARSRLILDSPLKFALKLKRLPWFELSILLVLLGINGYAAFSDAYNLPNRWLTRDDAYYYFKVAQNISEGHGSTFDGINPTNGYHPLWMLVCIPIFALARFDLILSLRILILVLAGLRAATSILLYHLLKKVIARPVAMFTALYWAFDYYIHWTTYQQGLETGLAAFCLVLFLYLLQRFELERKTAFRESHSALGGVPLSGTFLTAGDGGKSKFRIGSKWKQIAFLALAAALVMFSRLDLVFLAGLFGLWIVFRDRPLRYLLPLDILLLTISSTGAFIFRIGLPEYYLYANTAILTLAVTLALKIPLLYFLGLYDHPKAHSKFYLLRQSAIAIAISSIATLAILLGLTSLGILDGSFPRTVPIIDGILSFVLVFVSRWIISLFSQRSNVQADSPVERLKSNWRTWRSEGTVYYGILVGSLGLYMLWSRLAFGTASPVSGQIKRWWGSFGSRVYGGSARSPLSFFGIDPESEFNAWAPLTNIVGNWNGRIEMVTIPIDYDLRYFMMLSLLLTGFGLLLFLNRKRSARIVHELALIPLLAGSFLQVIQYNISGYSAPKEWYWVSEMVFITLAGSFLLDILTQKLRRIPAAYVSIYLMVIAWGVSSAVYFARITAAQMPYGAKPADTPYMEVATFVETYTEPGSLIGMTGGGNVGYFIRERTIVNMDGLINSYPYFQANKAYQGSDYLYNMGLDYIFANPDFLEIQPYRGQYTGRLEIIDQYGGKAIMRFLAPNPVR